MQYYKFKRQLSNIYPDLSEEEVRVKFAHFHKKMVPLYKMMWADFSYDKAFDVYTDYIKFSSREPPRGISFVLDPHYSSDEE